MPSRSLIDLARRPGALGAFLFLATLLLSAALAWEAAGAAASHRAAVETSLRHHATIAAWRFAREGRSWLGYDMGQAGDLLQQEVASRATLPGPEVLRSLLAQKECDCITAAFGRSVFLLSTSPDASLTVQGDSLTAATRDSLVVLMRRAAADTAPRQGPRSWLILPPGEPLLPDSTATVLLWKVGDRDRGVRAVYGMLVEPMQLTRPLQGAMGDAQFFPPSLVPHGAADSLVRIEVTGPNGRTFFRSGPDTRLYRGTDTLGSSYGHLTVLAAIDPAAARALVDGGLPPSRASTIVMLLGITLVMGLGALALLRREYRLARLREDFVSGVSHELRTPLTQIRVFSELLEQDGFHDAAERRRAVTVIHRESLRLSNLVDNILEFTRLRRRLPARPVVAVPVHEVVAEVAEVFSPLLQSTGSRLLLDVDRSLVVPGDRDALGRILRNLIENALKYGPREQAIRIEARAIDAALVRLVVEDQGPGIPSGEWPRIWQPYYRLERDRNAPAGGSGLGLSVVADLVRQLGGEAWVGHGADGGARFTVQLPRAAPPPAEAP